MSIFDKMSKPEKEVSKFLEDMGIWWKFEEHIYLKDDGDRPRIWTPDFFLPKLGMYVEVCGSDEFNYDYREKIYDKNICPVIFVHFYKEEKWKRFLLHKILEIQEKRNKYADNVIENAKKLGYQIS